MQDDGEDEEQHCSPEAQALRARLLDVFNLPRVVALPQACHADRLQRNLTTISIPADQHGRADADIIEALQSAIPLLPKGMQQELTRTRRMNRHRVRSRMRARNGTAI